MASLNLKTFMSNKTKRCLLNVQRASPGALRRGTARGNAAPQPSSPRPIQSVRFSRHAYRLDAKHAEALKPSILITPTLFQVFVKLPCPCQVRCPGNPVWCYLNIHVNIYNEYSDKYSFKYLHEYLWWNRDIYFTKKNIQKDFFVLRNILLNIQL